MSVDKQVTTEENRLLEGERKLIKKDKKPTAGKLGETVESWFVKNDNRFFMEAGSLMIGGIRLQERKEKGEHQMFSG